MTFDIGSQGTVALDAYDSYNPPARVAPQAPRYRPQREFASNLQADLLQRIFDVIGATAILVAALPFLILLATLLQIDSPGNLFFVHQRVGRGGRSFPCLKFRTMCADADARLAMHLANCPSARAEWARDHKLRNDPRITRLGHLVRRLSLDEFPQLLNVLAGQMSLVGPRPIIASEIHRYGRFFADYCRVRPGLTGLWQVNGRNQTSYRRRVSLDRYYARRRSIALDIAILARTIPVVISARGAY